MQGRRHQARAEVTYRTGHVGTVDYYTSRCSYGDSSMVVYRFPCLQPKSGPDFVLVHGIGVSARSYGPTAAALAEHGDVYLLDLPGYGRSPRPDRDMTIADHARIVGQFLTDTNLDHPVVVGHSMGTQVVLQMAADFPDQLDHLALIAPVLAPETRSILTATGLLLRNGLREPPLVMGEAMVDYLFRAGIPYMIQQTPHLLTTDLEELAAVVSALTLVICGKDDPIVPLEWARKLSERFERGWFATVPGPHASMFAAPQLIADLLDEHAHR